ncbi:glycoside hydrolase family 19 protein [Flavobacterium sp. GCM10027622]|uniref:glycoside hydrolase family 19 protein n=1 Tax=unclassified Flavobacterium TaxID=196869 RepID=UPI00361F51B7
MIDFVYKNAGTFLVSMARNGINTPIRIYHFLGQTAHETNGFTRFEESLNYSAASLKVKFTAFSSNPGLADKYGRTTKQKANQIMIANIAYANRMGNGSVNSGDGWKFRGRGLIHLTGRANYEAYKKYSGIDVVSNPELASRLDIAIDIACWFWSKNKLNTYADRNDSTGLTKIINGGSNGLKDRISKTNYFKETKVSIDVLKKKNQASH